MVEYSENIEVAGRMSGRDYICDNSGWPKPEWQKLIRHIVRRRGVRLDEVDDVAADIEIHLYKIAENYDPARSQPQTFVTLYANYAVSNYFRKNRQDVPTESLDGLLERDAEEGFAASQFADNTTLSPEQEASFQEDWENLYQVINEAGKAWRNCLLYNLRGYGKTDIAKHLGLPLGTVGPYLKRGWEHLLENPRTCDLARRIKKLTASDDKAMTATNAPDGQKEEL